MSKLLSGLVTIAISVAPTVLSRPIRGATVVQATDGTQLPLFEVISIRVNNSGASTSALGMEESGDTFTAVNATLARIVQFAFGFRRGDLVVGSPNWAQTIRYDVVAKIGTADVARYHKLTVDQRRLMLQQVLTECCGMKAHFDNRDMPIYALVIAKSGIKMKENHSSDPIRPSGIGPDGQQTHEEALYRSQGKLVGQAIPIRSLALALSSVGLDRPVVDQTDLVGRFDFSIAWKPEPNAGPEDAATIARSDAPETNIFTAIQEQLGLKLEPTKGSVQVLVIDELQKPPEN